MATINKTFSVKNGIDVANTIIISNTAGTINLSNISIANTTTINSTNFLTSAGLDVVGQANAAFGQANAAYGQANAAYTAANTGINTVAVSANAAGTLTSKQLNFNNSASILVSVVSSSDGTNANVSFTTSGASAGAAYDQANAAYTQANNAYGGANTANTNALNAYGQANAAYGGANTANTNALNAYAQANTSGNTVWIYANGTSVLSKSNINFNNTATVNVSATANGTTQSNIAFAVNVSSTDWASGANSSAQTIFGTINTSFGTLNTTFGTTNTTFTTHNTTFGTVNTNIGNAYSQANLAYTAANTAQTSSNTVYGQANAAYGQANLAYTAANSAQTSANTVYGQANAAYGQANLAYGQANTAYGQANLAYAKANASVQNTGGTITGSLNVNTDLIVGNLYVTGSTTNINTINLIVDSNTILLAANQTTAVVNAYISVERGGAINTSIIWNEQTGQWGYSEPANATFVAFDTIYTLAITGNNTANGAYTRANLAYTAANSAQTSSNTVYGQANTAYGQANLAYSAANSAGFANPGVYANSGLILANIANISFYNTATTNAIITANGTQGVNASFTVNVSYDFASGANSSAQTTFGTINTTFGTTNTSITTAYGQANAAYGQANAAYGQANGAYGQANAAYGKANTSAVYANGTIVIGNTANINFNNTATVNVVATANGTLQSNISFTVNTAAITSTPGGSNTQLQFNNNSVFGGTSNLSFNINQNVFTVGTNTLVANATGNYVNIATANISTTITSNLQVVALNVTTNTVTTAAITQVVVDTWPSGAGGLATAKYLVQANSNTIYHITEATLVTDGTNAYLSEFGTIQTAQPLGTLSATVTGGAAQLLYTPASTTSTQIKVVRYGVTY